jgi:uncharacterized RDD family membrane protein YckC
MAICPSCHRDLAQNAAFCNHCGAVLDRPSTGAAAAPVEGPRGSAAPADPFVGPRTSSAQTAVAHRFEFGDVGAYIVRRLLALGVDMLIVLPLLAVALRAGITGNAPAAQLSIRGFFELAVSLIVAFYAYRWLFEGLFGTTIGKLVFALHVHRQDGQRAGLIRAFFRTLLLPLDLALIGFLLAALTPQRRRLGDLIAGTVVANARIGAGAPVIGIVLLGACVFGVYAYAGGGVALGKLAQETQRLAPSLLRGVPTPAPQTPLPVNSPPAVGPSPSASESPSQTAS